MQRRLFASASVLFLVAACSSSGSGDGNGLSDDSGAASILDGGATSDGSGFDVGSSCPKGAACGTGGVCNSAGTCCTPAISACGDKCCGGGQVCYGGACVTPGKVCRSVDDCADGETCDPALGDPSSDAGVPACGDAASGALGRCVPRPPICPPGVDPSGGTCTAVCEYHPPVGTFDAITEWSWPFASGVPEPTYNQVMAAAVVGPLTDDNCDGKYDARDIPAIVFNTYTGAAYGSDGILRAVTGRGAPLWDATDASARTVPGASIALGEMDATSPGPEIATCQSASGKLIVFSAKGKVLWTTDDDVGCVYGGPQLGDVDADGSPELLVRYRVIDSKTHKVRFTGRVDTFAYPTADYSTFADVDRDGDLDIVGGNVVYANDGKGTFSPLWDGTTFATPIPDGYPAVADLVGADGFPEIVNVSSLEQSMHTIRVLDGRTGKTIWGPIDTNMHGETETGGGPPTIADFNGDGLPEIAMAGGYTYNVFNGQTGAVLWSMGTTDHSSRVTGSSVFDFDGNGEAEVIYADERNLHVYDGKTGKEEITLCNPSGTLWEYPLVADVDGDDQAEIVLVANDMWWGCGAGLAAGTGPTGLRVLGSKSGNWVKTRRIWNEHTYHVTNVNDDATIPAKEVANWTVKGLNDFRQNVQPKGQFDAPDAIVDVDGSCASPALIEAHVRNIGQATLPAGVNVGFYSGTPTSATKAKIGSGVTKSAIAPGGFETVTISWAAPPEYHAGSLGVFAVVDDGSPTHAWHECKTDNDTSAVFTAKCAK